MKITGDLKSISIDCDDRIRGFCKQNLFDKCRFIKNITHPFKCLLFEVELSGNAIQHTLKRCDKCIERF